MPLLLFTRCANSNGFCRCFAFQIGKICYQNYIVRDFQFRKFLPCTVTLFQPVKDRVSDGSIRHLYAKILCNGRSDHGKGICLRKFSVFFECF